MPSFEWKVSIKFFPFIFIFPFVKEEFKNGIGRSLVKLALIFALEDQTSPEISESSLRRLLIEFIMIPTTLVPSSNLHWEAIDFDDARVVLKGNNFELSAIFHFGSNEPQTRTSIDRYGKFEGKLQNKLFGCDLLNYKLYQGLLMPTDIRGCWDIKPDIHRLFEIKNCNVFSY